MKDKHKDAINLFRTSNASRGTIKHDTRRPMIFFHSTDVPTDCLMKRFSILKHGKHASDLTNVPLACVCTKATVPKRGVHSNIG